LKRESAKLLTATAIVLFVACMVNFQVTTGSSTLEVPSQYSTISEAVNHASPGDTIIVQKGVYTEDVIVNKTLTLTGQSGAIIVGIGGSNPSAAVTLAADNIVISGFTIKSTEYANTTWSTYGILVNGDKCTITDNTILGTYVGIFSSVQSYTIIKENIITESIKDGIRFAGGSQNTFASNNITANKVSAIALNGYSNTVTNNILNNNTRGIGLGASNSVVFGNTIQFNSESAIWLGGSQNIISANSFSDNKYGIYVSNQSSAPTANKLYSNNFADNTFNAFDSSTGLIETWDNGSSNGGNYWSDYKPGTGSPVYMINQNNKDNYPLLAPVNTQNIGSTPTPISQPSVTPGSIIASWSFNTVQDNLVTPDSEGNNPAVLGSETAVYNYTPAQVPSKFGYALNFTGNVYAAVHPSLSLETPNEFTIDAWINLQEIKPDIAYNNIFIEAVRTIAALPTRTLGLAINGQIPENTSSPAIGALRGYVLTSTGLNEIDTINAVPFNTWVHVVFTRSESTGMHIYVDGKEQAVMVTSGTANPSGPIQRSTDIYIGHDATVAIDELKISNTVEPMGQPLWLQWWIWVAVIFTAMAGSGLMLFNKKRRKIKVKETIPAN